MGKQTKRSARNNLREILDMYLDVEQTLKFRRDNFTGTPGDYDFNEVVSHFEETFNL